MRVVFSGGALIAGGVAVILMISGDTRTALIPGLVASVLAVCLVLFHSLTVRVGGSTLALRYGIGVVRICFRLVDIQHSNCVQNHWYYGWGIKLTPHGWLYNVSGFDAVEIELENGRKYRIGTDEPVVLQAAIESAVAAVKGVSDVGANSDTWGG